MTGSPYVDAYRKPAARHDRSVAAVNILICDDHVVFADSLGQLLTGYGATVVGVTYHPTEAIHVLRDRPVDVTVTDVMFGSENVLPLLPELQGASPQTRTVLLTGRLSESLVASARLCGVSGFAEKRQSGLRIMDTIERVAAGESVSPAGYAAAEPGTTMSPETATARALAAFLTLRERQVVSLLVAGRDTATIARTLAVTHATARSHVQATITKLNVHSRLEAATLCVRAKIVDAESGVWLM